MAEFESINIRQIAVEAGVSHITVSRALRGQSNVAEATRQRILATAERLGYKSNPLVQAYTAHIRRSRAGGADQCNLVWLRSFQGREAPMHAWQRSYFDGAKNRAESLGYSLDASINAHELSDAQLERLLDARGVRGVILPFLDYFYREPFLSDRFATVAIGENPSETPIHTVTPDYFKDMTAAMDRLIAYGYQRIGFCEHGFNTALSQGSLYGAYLLNQQRIDPENRLPALVGVDFDNNENGGLRTKFLDWIHQESPDAVIVTFSHVFKWLEEAGLGIPRDIAVAHMGLEANDSLRSGIAYSDEQIGAAAIDLLTAHILRNEYALPTIPKHMKISGEWIDSTTTIRPAGEIKAFLPASQSHPMEWFETELWGKER